MANLSDAGTKYDVVLEDLGIMLAGLMTRSDVTNLMPRVSVATDQRQYHDFSELETFGQTGFHHGRGQLEMSDPEAFFDSQDMDLRFPNKAFPALAPTAITDLGGNITDLLYYADHATADRQKTLWALVEKSSASFSAQIEAGADDGDEEDDTTWISTRTQIKTGRGSGVETLTKTIGASGYDGYLRKVGVDTPVPYTTPIESIIGQAVVPTRKWRSYLRFDTHDIPDGATIDSVKLRLRIYSNFTWTDFLLRVRQYNWGTSLTSADWRSTPSSDTQIVNDFNTLGLPYLEEWLELDFNAAGLAAINKTAYTEMYLTSSRDEAGNTPMGDELFAYYTFDKGSGYIPELVVTYSGAGVPLSYDGALRFTAVAVPNAATITSAKITLYNESIVGSPVLAIVGINVDICAAFSQADRPSMRAQTSPVAWSPSGAPNQNYDTPSLTALVQSIVNRVGWASNAAMGFIIKENIAGLGNYALWKSFEGSDSLAAVLQVTYTGGGANALYYLKNTDDTLVEETAGLATAGGGAVSMEVHGGNLFVCQHTTAVIRWYRGSGTPNQWNTMTAIYAKYLKSHDGALWRAAYDGSPAKWRVYHSTNPDAASPTWNEISILASTVPITGLDAFSNLLIVHFEDGVWQIEKDLQGNYRAFRPINQIPNRDPNNGAAHTIFKERYYYSERAGVMEFDGFGVQSVGPDRADLDPYASALSLSPTWLGPTISLTTDGEFLWALTYSVTRQGVLVFNSNGWCQYSGGLTGETSSRGTIHFNSRQSSSPSALLKNYDTLWFSAGSKLYYIAFDPNQKDPSAYDAVNGSAFRGEAYLQTSWYGPLPAVPKNWLYLLVDLRRVAASTAHSLDVYWQVDGGSQWEKVPNSLQSATVSEILLPYGSLDMIGVLGSKIRLRFVLKVTSSVYVGPPALVGYALRHAFRPVPKLGWTLPVKVYSTEDLLDHTSEVAVTLATRRRLLELIGRSPLLFNDGSPPVAATNMITNPSLEEPFSSNIPHGWTAYSSPFNINPVCSLKPPVANPRGTSWAWDIWGGSSERGLRTTATFAITSLGCRVSAWVCIIGSGAAYLHLIEDATESILYTTRGTKQGWQRLSLVYTPSVNRTVYIRVSGFGAYGARLIVDCVEFVTDASYPLTDYIDGEQPRCAWNGVPHNSTSSRRGHYVVYVTGMSEAFRFAQETQAGVETWDSQVTLSLREAA